MKSTTLLILLVSLSTSLAAQVILSPSPSSEELKVQFTKAMQAESDPYKVLQAVAQLEDGAVPGLTALVNEPVDPNASTEVIGREERSKVYATMSLESIGTESAYRALISSARQGSGERRGIALNALSTTYYDRVRAEGWTPDKEVIHVLLAGADDPSDVNHLNTTVAATARSGLNTWIGWDLGDSVERTITVGKDKKTYSISEYREVVWRDIENRLTWNPDLGRFEVGPK
ncbi:MAG: hypothetical protein IH628_17455 [Proteobacteria bacterium]|nr:hypothetical protein [Pseudomonadota bacterium]